MSDTVTVAIVSASGSVVVAVMALLLNFRMFASLERRLELIEADLKQFYRDIVQIKQKIGLE